MENIANEIENGFKAFGGGLREAGQKRNQELVAKQGYVGFKNEVAAQTYQKQNPDWRSIFVDGEYRFYPPNLVESKILETFRNTNQNFSGLVVVTINILDDSGNCKYTLRTTDKTGVTNIVQEEVVNFDGKFSREILPSIYYSLSNGLPVMEQEKSINDKYAIYYSNVDQSRMLQLGNLTLEQFNLIHEMKQYVDAQLGLTIDTPKI